MATLCIFVQNFLLRLENMALKLNDQANQCFITAVVIRDVPSLISTTRKKLQLAFESLVSQVTQPQFTPKIPWFWRPFVNQMVSMVWQMREFLHLCLCQSLHLPNHVTKILPKLFWGLGNFLSIFGIIDVHRLKSSSCFFSVFWQKNWWTSTVKYKS